MGAPPLGFRPRALENIDPPPKFIGGILGSFLLSCAFSFAITISIIYNYSVIFKGGSVSSRKVRVTLDFLRFLPSP